MAIRAHAHWLTLVLIAVGCGKTAPQPAESLPKLYEQFVVHEAQLWRRPDDATTTLFLSVTNNTPHAVSLFTVRAEYITPDRQVPWARDTLSYRIPGGLEPGESAEWWFDPPISSELHTVAPGFGTPLRVQVIELLGADGLPLRD